MKSFILMLSMLFITCNIFAQTVEYPSTALFPQSMVDQWRSAGQFSSSGLFRKCYDVHDVRGYNIIESEVAEDTYLVDVDELNAFINSLGNSSNQRRYIFFKEGRYLLPKNKTINLNKTRLYLVGEGSKRTYFNIVSTSEWMMANVSPTTAFKMTADESGIGCLSIICNALINYHDFNIYPAFNFLGSFNFNKGTIEMNNIEDSYIKNIKITDGYGASVLITNCNNVRVFGSYFNDNMIHGGSGGLLGYGIMMRATDNSLIQNNHFLLNRHGVVIEGNGSDNNNNPSQISSFNVVAHNFFGEMACFQPCGTPFHPWGLTIHGHGRNHSNLLESNVLIDRLAIDDEHGSNGENNTFYRNFAGHKIEVEKINGCNGNSGQRIVANDVNRTNDNDAYSVKADDHLILNNRRRQGFSSNFIFANSLGICNFSSNSNVIFPNSLLGNSLYLSTVPNWLTSNFNTIGSGSSETNKVPALVDLENDNFPSQSSCGCIRAEQDDDHAESIKGGSSSSTRKGSDLNVVTDVRVYPSPMTTQANIEIKLVKDAKVRLEILDLQGRLLNVIAPAQTLKSGANQFTIERGNWVAGLYLLRVTIDGEIITKKFVIQ